MQSKTHIIIEKPIHPILIRKQNIYSGEEEKESEFGYVPPTAYNLLRRPNFGPKSNVMKDPYSFVNMSARVAKHKRIKSNKLNKPRFSFSFFTKKNKKNHLNPTVPKGARFKFFTRRHKVQPMIMNPYFEQNKEKNKI